MEPDPLQWLWDGVNDFQTKFNDLRTRAMRNFQRPYDFSQHEDNCGLKNSQARMPCSCCKGSLTFDEARLVKEKLTGGRAMPNKKDRDFKSRFPRQHAGALKIARNCLVLAVIRKQYLLPLKPVPETTKRTFSSAAAVLYRVRSIIGELNSTTPSSSSRICVRSSSNRALRHRKHSARRRRPNANASTPS